MVDVGALWSPGLEQVIRGLNPEIIALVCLQGALHSVGHEETLMRMERYHPVDAVRQSIEGDRDCAVCCGWPIVMR